MSAAEAADIHALTDLISSASSGPARRIFPTDDQIIAVLHARSRAEHPYTRVGISGREYVVMNPLRTLGCLNEESRERYSADIEQGGEKDRELQPSVYGLAGQVWYLMSRRKESQAVVYQSVPFRATGCELMV
jgi:chitin synthase